MMKSELLGSMMKSDSRMKLLALEQSSRIAQVFGSMVSMMSMMMLGQSSRKVGLRPEVEPRLHKLGWFQSLGNIRCMIGCLGHWNNWGSWNSLGSMMKAQVFGSMVSMMSMMMLGQSSRKVGLRPEVEPRLHKPVLPEPDHSTLVPLEPSYSKPVLRLVLHYSRSVLVLLELHYSKPVLRLVLHYSKSMLVLLELHYSKLVLRLVLHYSRPVPKLPELKHSRQ
jgi:hypothetical protein